MRDSIDKTLPCDKTSRMLSWGRVKHLALVAALVLLAGRLIWLYVVPSWQTIVTDFPNYYVSAWAVRHGEPLTDLYNPLWFDREKRRAGIERPEALFNYFPPMNALIMWPLAYLPPLTAKRAWTVVNVIVLIAVVHWTSKSSALKWSVAMIVALLGGDALGNNFTYGQFYLVLTLLMLFGALFSKQFPSRGRNPIGAEYETPWNKLQQQPATYDQIPVQIRNTGFRKWRAQGVSRIGVAYRWLNTETGSFVQTTRLATTLPHDVEPGEAVDVQVRFQTPSVPGKYLLALELYRDDFDWFSRSGVVPALVEADIRPSIARLAGVTDLSNWYQRNEDPNALTASVPRSLLWRAALWMLQDHPLGVGPDNYRLQYGKYLGAKQWDMHITSNSLYLELLTESGFFGVASFALMFFLMRWRADAACLAVAVFLLHGLVDVFLMATPIYFAFWISLAKSS
jgi:Glycosyltransferase family 87